MAKKIKEHKSNWHNVKDGWPLIEGEYLVTFVDKKKEWVSMFNFVNDLSTINTRFEPHPGFYGKDNKGKVYEVITAKSYLKWH